MKLLGIETSSLQFSVALSEGKRVIAFRMSEGSRERPSSRLTELIQEVMKEAGWTLDQLDGLVASIGPGSFTGLRVGIMTAKALAWALKKPVLPVSSLEVLAQNVRDGPRPVVPFVDARKGKVYVRIKEDELLPPEEAIQKLPQGACLVGDGVERYKALIEERGDLKVAAPEHWTPRADHLCRIGVHRWPQDCLSDPHPLAPQYLYSKESDVTGW